MESSAANPSPSSHFALSVATNANDRHWTESSCYRTVDTCDIPSSGVYLQDWKAAKKVFASRHPRVIALFGVGARVSIHIAPSPKSEIAKFAYGLRGKRENPVSLRQIRKRFSSLGETALHACINDLLTEGKVSIIRNGPRSGHSHRQGYSYVPGDASC